MGDAGQLDTVTPDHEIQRLMAEAEASPLGLDTPAWPSITPLGHGRMHGARRHLKAEVAVQLVSEATLPPGHMMPGHLAYQGL